jgi:uncharacterized membrane protein (DUF2068 family)
MEPKTPFGLRLIAGAKIVKGVAWAGLALGLFDLIHKDLTGIVHRFVTEFRISPENRFVVLALDKLGVVDPGTLRKLGILTALDASVQLLEGLGLWFGAWWAEYLIVISTGLFVPAEAEAVYQKFSAWRLAIFITNLVMLAYVFQLVLRRHLARRAARHAAKLAEAPPPPPAP